MNTEELEARRSYVHRYPPREASPYMQKENFNQLYLSRWTYQTREILQQVEQAEQVLHCLSCREEAKWGMIEATRLHITYEEDLLKNFKSVMHGRCGRCNAEEMIGLSFRPSDMVRVNEFLRCEPHNSPLAAKLRQMMPIDVDDCLIHRNDLVRLQKELTAEEMLRRQQSIVGYQNAVSSMMGGALQPLTAAAMLDMMEAYGLPAPSLIKDADFSAIEQRIIAERPGLWERITGGKR